MEDLGCSSVVACLPSKCGALCLTPSITTQDSGGNDRKSPRHSLAAEGSEMKALFWLSGQGRSLGEDPWVKRRTGDIGIAARCRFSAKINVCLYFIILFVTRNINSTRQATWKEELG